MSTDYGVEAVSMAELQDSLVALITAVIQREEFISDGKWLTDAIIRFEEAVREDETLAVSSWIEAEPRGYLALASRIRKGEHRAQR